MTWAINVISDRAREVRTYCIFLFSRDMEVLKQQDVMTRLQKNIEQLEHVNGMQEQVFKKIIS